MKKRTSQILALATATAILVTFVWLLNKGGFLLNTESLAQPSSTPPSVTYEEPERFSRGERVLFTDITNVNLKLGTEAFRISKFSEAIGFFTKAVAADPNRPEPQIYLNNAQAELVGSPFIAAVVVPVDGQENNALEILRGVADSQTTFNNSGGVDNRLLEILIVNDSDDLEKAANVAEQIVEDRNILGVIGHNTSSASKAGLAVYEKAKLAMITPTSASTLLSGPVFFRAVFSNEALSKKLSDYTVSHLRIDNVVIFSNPDDAYSGDAQRAFEKHFEEAGGRFSNINLKDPSFDPSKSISDSVSQKASAAILLPSTALARDIIPLAKENAKLPSNNRLLLLGGQSMYRSDLLSAAKESLQGLIVAAPWDSKVEESRAFAENAEKRWAGEINYRTAGSFDATQAFTKALSGDASRTTVLQNLRSTNLPPSETSGFPLKFSPQGEREGEPVLVKVVATDNPRQPYSFEPVE
jgi:branched-chain amino acid transport system substrate-binding protein